MKFSGCFLVALAALMWGTDGFFRVQGSEALGSVTLVFYEHMIGALLLMPSVFALRRHEFIRFHGKEIVLILIVTLFGSVGATLAFTKSFELTHSAIPVLLQKLQPVWVLCLSKYFLNERLQKRYAFWAVVSLILAVFVSIPDPTILKDTQIYFSGCLLAALSVFLWGITTIADKILLYRHGPSALCLYQYSLGTIVLASFILFTNVEFQFQTVESKKLLLGLIFLANWR